MNKTSPLIQSEIWLILILLTLLTWGGFTIYSSSSISGEGEIFGWKQLIWCGVGVLVIMLALLTDFDRIYRHAFILAGLILLPLLLVWFCGIKINGMRGWYDLGGIYFQPSELGKPIYLLLICRLAASAVDTRKCAFMLLTCFIVFSLPLVLQPDFGTILVYGAITAMVFWIYAGKIKWLLSGMAVVFMPLAAIALSQPYVLRRFQGYLYPEDDPFGTGWHTLQLRYAMASGGMTGRGTGEALWSNAYLPYSYCDSAFAAMTETTGAIGGIITVVLFVMIAVLCLRIGSSHPDPIRRGFIFCGGIMICIQAFIHISVNVTLFPVTGLTCPLLSYGGSSLTGTLLLVGMIFAAIRTPDKKKSHG